MKFCWSWVICLVAMAESAGAPQGRVLADVEYLEPGRKERLDLYLPPAGEGKLAPVLVWMHGGGWVGGDKAAGREKNIATNLNAAGYAVVSVSYKLGENAWPQNLHDCKNAVRFVRARAAQYGLDPMRIAIGGGSAGGHLALLVGLTSGKKFEPAQPYPKISNEVSAVVNFYGPSDLFGFLELDAGGRLTSKRRGPSPNYLPAFGPPEGREDALRAASPITHVEANSPPILTVHGRTDTTVPVAMLEEFAVLLKTKGVPHELVILEGVGHSFDLEAWKKRPLPRDLRPIVLNFLDQHLGKKRAAPATE